MKRLLAGAACCLLALAVAGCARTWAATGASGARTGATAATRTPLLPSSIPASSDEGASRAASDAAAFAAKQQEALDSMRRESERRAKALQEASERVAADQRAAAEQAAKAEAKREVDAEAERLREDEAAKKAAWDEYVRAYNEARARAVNMLASRGLNYGSDAEREAAIDAILRSWGFTVKP